MISLLRRGELQIFWIFFHAALGFACVQTKWAIISWFALMVLSMFFAFFGKGNIQHTIIYFMGYSLAVEVLARGVNASPYIPDQLGKYLGVIMFSIGLILGGPIRKVSLYGLMMLLLSLPGLAIAPEYTRAQIVFNYFGPLALFLGVIFCSRQIMTFSELKQLCQLIVYPIISLACFTIFKAAQFERIEYGVTANFDASGGSITNQVATLFGTAICILFLMYITKQKLFRYRILDIGLLILFALRGLITFSRGGLISAALAIIAVLLFPKARAIWQDYEISMRSVNKGRVFVGALILTISFIVVNRYTNNYLLYRYQGETERSLSTGFRTNIDLDQLTTGRYQIFLSDLRMFLDNAFLGVGVGWSAKLRGDYGGEEGTAAHLELSRLLAEHGIPGLILVIMIYIYPFVLVYREPNNYRKSVMLVFLIMGLTATFHSAMRTMVTPLLFAFAFIKFVPTDFDWRAQLKGMQTLRHRKNKLVTEPAMPEPGSIA